MRRSKSTANKESKEYRSTYCVDELHSALITNTAASNAGGIRSVVTIISAVCSCSYTGDPEKPKGTLCNEK